MAGRNTCDSNRGLKAKRLPDLKSLLLQLTLIKIDSQHLRWMIEPPELSLKGFHNRDTFNGAGRTRPNRHDHNRSDPDVFWWQTSALPTQVGGVYRQQTKKEDHKNQGGQSKIYQFSEVSSLYHYHLITVTMNKYRNKTGNMEKLSRNLDKSLTNTLLIFALKN